MARPRNLLRSRGRTFTVEADWTRGMLPDIPATGLPAGYATLILNMLVHERGHIYKRGGTTYFTDSTTPSSLVTVGWYVPYGADPDLVVIDDLGKLYTFNQDGTTSAGPSTIGGYPRENIKQYEDYLVITTGSTTVAPKFWGSSFSSLPVTAPYALYSEVHAGRLLLGGPAQIGGSGTSYLNRLWFGPTLNPLTTTWDTANAYIDFGQSISGLASIGGVLLVFSSGNVERLLGDVPPPGSNMSRQPFAQVGCPDARTIARWSGNVIWANQNGVWITNGSAVPRNLCDPGMSDFYRTLMANYSSGWRLAGGVFRDNYIVTATSAFGVEQFTLMVNLNSGAWVLLSGLAAMSYAVSYGEQERLFFARSDSDRVHRADPMWTPAATNTTDANGDQYALALYTRLLGEPSGFKHWRDLWVNYKLTEASYTPSVSVGTSTNIGEVVDLTDTGDLLATSGATRTRLPVGRAGPQLAATILCTDDVDAFAVYSLEADATPLATGAVGTPA